MSNSFYEIKSSISKVMKEKTRSYIYALSKITLFLVLVTLFSCKPKLPNDIGEILKRNHTNSKELIKIIKHYQKANDSLRLEATYFLIRNMEGHVSVQGKILKPYIELHNEVIKKQRVESSFLISKLKDSIFFYHQSELNDVQEINDIDIITSDLFIENLEHSFYLWQNMPWTNHLNFNEFCELILPYRISNEPLQSWKTTLFNDYKYLFDTLKATASAWAACEIVNNEIFKKYYYSDCFDGDPLTPVLEMHWNQVGACYHRYIYVTAVMRSLGLPVTIDFTPQYGRWNGNHSWTVILNSDHHYIPFNGGDTILYGNTNRVPVGSCIASKVYRNTYGKQKNTLALLANKNENLPLFFQNSRMIDVTNQYSLPLTDLEFSITEIQIPENVACAYLAAFDQMGTLIPVDWCKIEHDKLFFKHISASSTYVPVLFYDEELLPIEYPVTVQFEKDVIQRNPLEKNETITIYRKYPPEGLFEFGMNMLGCRFEGSNLESFYNCENLYSVDTFPDHFMTSEIRNKNSFRYVRYFSNNDKNVDVAEIEFYGLNEFGKEIKLTGKTIGNSIDSVSKNNYTNLFDNNIRTYYHGSTYSWVGYDLGKKYRITKIRYLGRNNFNIIEVGDTYELYYFDLNGWNSLGKKVATSNNITYDNVPKNALLYLRNLSRGKQERVFVYDNGHQVWW